MNKGRKKQKVFVYREDGSRYAEFESETEFAKHFDVDKNFMSRKRKKQFGEDIVKIFDSGLYACNEPIGRVRARLYAKKINSEFVRKRKETDREIGCYNLERELIATFKSKFHLMAFVKKGITILDKHPKSVYNDLYYKYL